jgi:hypothetical protein
MGKNEFAESRDKWLDASSLLTRIVIDFLCVLCVFAVKNSEGGA